MNEKQKQAIDELAKIPLVTTSPEWLAGFDDAVAVFADRFFGGPTKDMVLAWFAEARQALIDNEEKP